MRRNAAGGSRASRTPTTRWRHETQSSVFHALCRCFLRVQFLFDDSTTLMVRDLPGVTIATRLLEVYTNCGCTFDVPGTPIQQALCLICCTGRPVSIRLVYGGLGPGHILSRESLSHELAGTTASSCCMLAHGYCWYLVSRTATHYHVSPTCIQCCS